MNEAASGTSSAPQVDKVSTDPSDVTEPVTSASSGDLLVDMTGSKVESTDEETVQEGEVVVVEPLPRDAPRTPSLRLMRLTATLNLIDFRIVHLQFTWNIDESALSSYLFKCSRFSILIVFKRTTQSKLTLFSSQRVADSHRK